MKYQDKVMDLIMIEIDKDFGVKCSCGKPEKIFSMSMNQYGDFEAILVGCCNPNPRHFRKDDTGMSCMNIRVE